MTLFSSSNLPQNSDTKFITNRSGGNASSSGLRRLSLRSAVHEGARPQHDHRRHQASPTTPSDGAVKAVEKTSNHAAATSTTSPSLRPSFSAVLGLGERGSHTRQASSTSSASTFQPAPIAHSGEAQVESSSLLHSPHPSLTTPASQSHQASSAAAATTATQGGGGGSSGGGRPSRGTSFSPPVSSANVNSPQSPSGSSIPASATSGGSNSTNAGQLSKIVVAQVFLLLSTLKEDKDRTKWDSQVDQIRKLIDSNGMEVYSKYFKRLLLGNAPQIFSGINRPVENAANYPLLVEELNKVTQDPEQARKIAETIDQADGDLFRDFDLSTFLEHFKLDALEKTVLALPFKTASKSDLRTKADAILSNNFQRLLDILAQSASSEDQKYVDLSSRIVARVVDGLLQYPPPNLNDDGKNRLFLAIRLRYQSQNSQIPTPISMALLLSDLLSPVNRLARAVQRAGPQATSTADTVREAFQSAGVSNFDEAQISIAILFMALASNWAQFSIQTFVNFITQHAEYQSLDWNAVVKGFDREGLRLEKDRFLAIFNPLREIAVEDSNFEIQALWGGRWEYPDTQRSFLLAFASCSPDELDASTIPRLQSAFEVDDFSNPPINMKDSLSHMHHHPLISLHAITALFDLVLQPSNLLAAPDIQFTLHHIIQPNMDIFLLAAMRVPKPWNEAQQSILGRLVMTFIAKDHQNHECVLYCLWQLDKQWLATMLVEAHSQDPMQLPLLLEHAQRHRWLDDLLGILNGFGFDLAALAHRQGIIELDQWAQNNAQRDPNDFATALSRFLTVKADDETNAGENEQRTVSLAVKTVHGMLQLLDEIWSREPRDRLTIIQRRCIQAYPRLINYSEGFDDVLDKSGEESNSIPSNVDAMMQDHYKKMYSGDREVREIVEALQKYKRSRDANEQDLFACMIHGLFDEYTCYQEYPLEALATTAVLFGGIINYDLISGIPLDVGLGMILEAVRDYTPETSMYKFGLQALLHCFGRLQEWPGFCSLLLQVPGLQGTEAFNKADEVVRENANQPPQEPEVNGLHSTSGTADGSALTNGNIDDMFPAESSVQNFAAIHVDPLVKNELYEEPDEDVQDKVLFVLNNVSEQNLDVKMKDLQDALEEKHHQWFAEYLVEQRAKMQPNFHGLYLEMLTMFGDDLLWEEVLRETYVSVSRMLNAQSTMESSTERTHLKNLANWLGCLTIGRSRPILFRNISFKDLLIEAYDTQRLIVVIPFTCKVLAQARHSTIFKPPSPWTMTIISLLVELYHIAELRLQLKFEIEVLCKDLELDHREIEPSRFVRDRPQQDDNVSGPTLPDGLDGFEDLRLPGLGRPNVRNERFSPAAITSSLPDIGSMLVYPPTPSTTFSRESLRYIVETAVRRAIEEITSPVVERSVTIAAISTLQLIHKDFAMEPNEDRVRSASLSMVKALAGSLALVTCKEPLRVSMSNHIRLLSTEFGEQTLPEGAILMCVNDNLDTACIVVENVASQRSIPEIEENIEQQLVARRTHRSMNTNQPFVDPIINKWAFYIPEPYRPSANGLNKEQMAIYEEFARQTKGGSSQASASASAGGPDSGRPLMNDTVTEPFPQVSHLSSSIDTANLPPSHRLQPQSLAGAQQVSQVPQLNGMTEGLSASERSQNLFSEMIRLVREASETRLEELNSNNPIFEIVEKLLQLIATSPHVEELAFGISKKICQNLCAPVEDPLEIEVDVQLLKHLCDLSTFNARSVTIWFSNEDDDRFLNLPVAVALIRTGLLDLNRMDSIVAKALQQRSQVVLSFFNDLLAQVLFDEKPIAVRADFAASLDVLAQWVLEEPDLALAQQMSTRLHERGMQELSIETQDERTLAMREFAEYAFDEWVRLSVRASIPPKSFTAFISQLHQKPQMGDLASLCTFVRFALDMSLDAFEHFEAGGGGSANSSFIFIDALARLIILVVKYRSETVNSRSPDRCTHMSAILSLITVVMNNHQTVRGDRFNQRPFFRLFSALLVEVHMASEEDPEFEQDVIPVFAETFTALQPRHFPGFTLAWLTLVSHRRFMPTLLLLPDQKGWTQYVRILENLLIYVGELVKPALLSNVSLDIYRGALRIFLLVHHDFPEFLAENHFYLCDAIPTHCAQLRNLILSACPSSVVDLPDPFSAGLKVDRINDIKRIPDIAADYEEPLRTRSIKSHLDVILRNGPMEDHIKPILDVINVSSKKETAPSDTTIGVDALLLTSIVLYVGSSAIKKTSQRGGPTFAQDSPETKLLTRFARDLSYEGRYYFFSAMVNQLRFPNAHTHYFSYALLFLFGNDSQDPRELEIKQQITRVLLERLIVHRPHPWGLIITLLELLKNPTYMFWELPFIKAHPDIERFIRSLVPDH